MKKSSLIVILILAIALVISGCVSKPESKPTVTPVANNTPSSETPKETPVVEKKASEALQDIRGPDPAVDVEKYLREHPLIMFPNLADRIIEGEFDGTRSIIRFRTSTSNPRQESIYLLGVQFLALPEIDVANVTGYNEDGKIIMAPDSRTQEKRSIYWKKYRTQTDWFPNLALEAECKESKDCNDSDNCTSDICLEDGFCSNSKIIKPSCP